MTTDPVHFPSNILERGRLVCVDRPNGSDLWSYILGLSDFERQNSALYQVYVINERFSGDRYELVPFWPEGFTPGFLFDRRLLIPVPEGYFPIREPDKMLASDLVFPGGVPPVTMQSIYSGSVNEPYRNKYQLIVRRANDEAQSKSK